MIKRVSGCQWVWIIGIVFSVLLAGAFPAFAQESSESPELPEYVRLKGLDQVWQDFNRCSAAAFSILISYYDVDYDYHEMISLLNPNDEDVSVRVEEMVTIAEQRGLKGIIRTGGSIATLRALVAAGFPVLVENVYYDGANGWQDWMGHNRVVMGYDDAKKVFLTFDSLLGFGSGRGREIDYLEFDERWQPFNRDYLVLYHPEEEAELRAALGDQWDPTYNAEFTLAQAEFELNGENPNSFSMFNKGSALVALGRYEEAAEVFDKARGLGLPFRMMWYQFGPFEAYLKVERYEAVLALAREVLSTTPGIEEIYYYAGLAYEGLGDTQRAEANYEVAILRNQYFMEPQNRLAELRGEVASTG